MALKQLPPTFRLNHIGDSLSHRLSDPRFLERLHFGSVLGLCVGLVLTFVILAGILGAAPSRLSDFLYQSASPSGQVVVVAIDDASIQQIGALPWQRATLATLVDALAQAQPRVIALDLILVEPASDDTTLAQAFARAPRIVQPVIGVDVSRVPPQAESFPHLDIVLAPVPVLQTANTQLGHSLIIPDSDNVVRRVPLAIETDGVSYPAFGVVAAQTEGGQSFTPQIKPGKVVLGAVELPVDGQGQLLLNFVSPNLRQTISAGDVLRGHANLAPLRDKIVLIGGTGAAAHGSFKTPLAEDHTVSTVEIQADLIETILSQRWLQEQDRLTQIVMIFLLAILAGATLPHVRFLSAAALTIIYFLMYLGYAFARFTSGVIVQPLYPILALFATFIGAMTFRYFYEDRRRAFIARLLDRYIAPDVVDQVARQWGLHALPLEGIRRTVTVLAIDLSDLETLEDSLAAEALIRLLNQYAGRIVGIIFQHDGAIIKQTGSAILAVWNLLTEQPEHARAAVRAAIEIKLALREFNRSQPKEFGVTTGVGIATGHVVAGRIGAANRAEYTLIGESVGMAERIALKPERGVFIDAETREQIGDEFDVRPVNPVRLRRKDTSALVWQLIEVHERAEETLGEIIEADEGDK